MHSPAPSPYPNVLQYRETAEACLLITVPPTDETAETVRCVRDVWLAACHGDVPALRMNLQLGADINGFGQPDPPYGPPFDRRTLFRAPPICYAAAYGREKAVAALLEDGADPKRRSSTGFTAKDYAQHRGYHTIVAIIEEEERRRRDAPK